MELVWTHKIFCFLFDITQFVGWDKLRRDRGIHNIEQRLRCHLARDVGDEVTDERLGHTSIDTIHRHVITIIGGPSQGEFREVARSDDNRILLVGNVHQDLRTLTCLRVLIGDIMNFRVLADILEMLGDSLSDIDLTDSNA